MHTKQLTPRSFQSVISTLAEFKTLSPKIPESMGFICLLRPVLAGVQGFVLAAAVSLFSFGCATVHGQQVVEPALPLASTPASEISSATYNVPTALNEEGQIKIFSHGIENLATAQSDEKVPALHVEVELVSHKHAQTWVMDLRNSSVTLTDSDPIAPAVAISTSKSASLPVFSLTQAADEKIQLYFPLPKDLRLSALVPGYTFKWQLQTAQQLITKETQFASQNPNYDRPLLFAPHLASRKHANLDTPASDEAQKVSTQLKYWSDPLSELPRAWQFERLK
jgi:hypothetical protein